MDRSRAELLHQWFIMVMSVQPWVNIWIAYQIFCSLLLDTLPRWKAKKRPSTRNPNDHGENSVSLLHNDQPASQRTLHSRFFFSFHVVKTEWEQNINKRKASVCFVDQYTVGLAPGARLFSVSLCEVVLSAVAQVWSGTSFHSFQCSLPEHEASSPWH